MKRCRFGGEQEPRVAKSRSWDGEGVFAPSGGGKLAPPLSRQRKSTRGFPPRRPYRVLSGVVSIVLPNRRSLVCLPVDQTLIPFADASPSEMCVG